jgi:hypothetical protein
VPMAAMACHLDYAQRGQKTCTPTYDRILDSLVYTATHPCISNCWYHYGVHICDVVNCSSFSKTLTKRGYIYTWVYALLGGYAKRCDATRRGGLMTNLRIYTGDLLDKEKKLFDVTFHPFMRFQFDTVRVN